MKKFYFSAIIALPLLLAGLVFCPGQVFAQAVQLTWDPSPSSDVAGYKIYYKAVSGELPLDGVEALEGPSPIDVGNVTSFTLSELPEGSVYHFCASAYDSAGNESVLSNMVTSDWLPATLAPTMNETVGTSTVLVWSTPPADLALSFTLRYGTDPNLETNTYDGRWFSKWLRRKLKRDSGFMVTRTINDLSDTAYTLSDLFSGTTYYWQVIATDDSGQQYASVISSFVAE